MPSLVTLYHVMENPKVYHKDLACAYLRKAREHMTLITFKQDDPGRDAIYRLHWERRLTLQNCRACGH